MLWDNLLYTSGISRYLMKRSTYFLSLGQFYSGSGCSFMVYLIIISISLITPQGWMSFWVLKEIFLEWQNFGDFRCPNASSRHRSCSGRCTMISFGRQWSHFLKLLWCWNWSEIFSCLGSSLDLNWVVSWKCSLGGNVLILSQVENLNRWTDFVWFSFFYKFTT